MTSASKEPSRLDPELLDDIVLGLDLEDADLLDRVRLSIQNFFRDTWQWLKDITGGEGGWLDPATDALRQWLEDFSGEPLPADAFLDAIYYGSLAILLALMGYGLYRAYLLFRPVQTHPHAVSYEALDPDLLKPLNELPSEKWTPALFSQVCSTLIREGRLSMRPDTTHAKAVASADVSEDARDEFQMLARAADRALFAGWIPSEDEFAELRACRDRLVGAFSK